MSAVVAQAGGGDFDRDELARRLARLSGQELQEFLTLVDKQRRAIAHFSGEGTLTAGPTKQQDLLSRVTATITTSWRVEAPEPAPAEASEAVPQGSGSGTTHWIGTATGEAPAIKSPAVSALWEYLKKVSPQDNTEFLATLEAVIKMVLIVWLMTGPTGVTSDILSAVQRALGDAVTAVQDQVEGDSEEPNSRE